MIRLFLILLLIGVPAASHGQEKFNPQTVMLSRFTFTRPADWQWLSTGPRADKKPGVTEVVFRIADPETGRTNLTSHINHHANSEEITAKHTIKVWRSWFESVRPSDPITSKEIIGTNKVTWIEYSGIYRAGKVDFTLFGALIEDGQGNIAARLQGPSNLVQKNKLTLIKMVETALKKE